MNNSFFNAYPAPAKATPGFTLYASTEFILIPTNEEGYTQNLFQETITIAGNAGGLAVPSQITGAVYNNYKGEISHSVLTNNTIALTFGKDANFNANNSGYVDIEVLVYGDTFTKRIMWAKDRSGLQAWNLSLSRDNVSFIVNSAREVLDFQDDVRANLYRGGKLITTADLGQPVQVFINGTEVPYSPNATSSTYVGSSRVEIYATVPAALVPYVTPDATDPFNFLVNITGDPVFPAHLGDSKIKVKYYSKYFNDRLENGTVDPNPTVVTLERDVTWIIVSNGQDAFSVQSLTPALLINSDEFGYIAPQVKNFDIYIYRGAHGWNDVVGGTPIGLPAWMTLSYGTIANGILPVTLSTLSVVGQTPQIPDSGIIELPIIVDSIDSDGTSLSTTFNIKIPWTKINEPESSYWVNLTQGNFQFNSDQFGKMGLQSLKTQLNVFKDGASIPYNLDLTSISYVPIKDTTNTYNWLTITAPTGTTVGKEITLTVVNDSVAQVPESGQIQIPVTIPINTFNSDVITTQIILNWVKNRKGESGISVDVSMPLIPLTASSEGAVSATSFVTNITGSLGQNTAPITAISFTGLPAWLSTSVSLGATTSTITYNVGASTPALSGTFKLNATVSGITFTKGIAWSVTVPGRDGYSIDVEDILLALKTDGDQDIIVQNITGVIQMFKGNQGTQISSITASGLPSWLTATFTPRIAPSLIWDVKYDVASVATPTSDAGDFSLTVTTSTGVVFTVGISYIVNKTGKDGYFIYAETTSLLIPSDATGILAYSLQIPIHTYYGNQPVSPTAVTISGNPSDMLVTYTTQPDGIDLMIAIAAGAVLGGNTSGSFNVNLDITASMSFNVLFTWSVPVVTPLQWSGLVTIAGETFVVKRGIETDIAAAKAANTLSELDLILATDSRRIYLVDASKNLIPYSIDTSYGTSPQASPSTGALWINSGATPISLNVWNGTSWVAVSYPLATTAQNGLMSSADKTALNSLISVNGPVKSNGSGVFSQMTLNDYAISVAGFTSTNLGAWVQEISSKTVDNQMKWLGRTNITLASWIPSSGYYTYRYSNVNIKSSTFIVVLPDDQLAFSGPITVGAFNGYVDIIISSPPLVNRASMGLDFYGIQTNNTGPVTLGEFIVAEEKPWYKQITIPASGWVNAGTYYTYRYNSPSITISTRTEFDMDITGEEFVGSPIYVVNGTSGYCILQTKVLPTGNITCQVTMQEIMPE